MTAKSRLPAKSKITTHFLMFYARVPEGFAKVYDVRLENGQIIIADRTAKKAGATGSIVETLKNISHKGSRGSSEQDYDQKAVLSAILCINHR
jgi:hypothetical protein